MTDRKPGGMSWESFVDRKIREAMERGEFDDLPGAGKPLPGQGQPYDRDWWLKEFMKRENVSLLPDTLALKKHIEEECERILELRYEGIARREVENLNEFIRERIRKATTGPASRAGTLDVDAFMKKWREQHSS